jgi:protein subunit release factor B
MKELLFSVTKKDLDISYFSGTGAGGQHRNRHKSCVRIRHKESGASGVGQRHKSKTHNTREALFNLVKHPRFQMFQSKKLSDKTVEDMMRPENLLIETKDKDGNWSENQEI